MTLSILPDENCAKFRIYTYLRDNPTQYMFSDDVAVKLKIPVSTVRASLCKLVRMGLAVDQEVKNNKLRRKQYKFSGSDALEKLMREEKKKGTLKKGVTLRPKTFVELALERKRKGITNAIESINLHSKTPMAML